MLSEITEHLSLMRFRKPGECDVWESGVRSRTLKMPFKEELEHHIRLMAALKMFELGKVSSGKAAELAGMSRIEFLETCGRYRVSPFNYSPEEAEEELKRDLREARKHIQQ
jgi:predicted HTH domain antitoxin